MILDQSVLRQDELAFYEREGYLIARGLFDANEIAAIRARFDALANGNQPVKGFFEPEFESSDPMKRFPRVLHPHRWDPFSKRMMLHPRVGGALGQIMGEDVVACSTMFYFKPPGSSGQMLHQDNFYLSVKPRTCIAAWTAIDGANPENGGMFVVPGSHTMDISCPDLEQVRSREKSNLVDIPPGMKAVPAILQPGDTLFFNGSLIHGSGRNRSATDWRRTFIAHYMPKASTHVFDGYFPIHDFDGNEIPFEPSPMGGPCGYGEGEGINSYGTDAVFH